MERDNPACPRCGSPMSCEKNPARTGGFLCVCGHVVEPSTRSLAFGHLDEPPCGIFRQIELRDAAGDLVCEEPIHQPIIDDLEQFVTFAGRLFSLSNYDPAGAVARYVEMPCLRCGRAVITDGSMAAWRAGLPDGPDFVLACVENDRGRRTVIRASYARQYELVSSPESIDEHCDYHEEQDEYYVPEGWYESNEFEEINWRVEGTVIGWMPLPSPPAKIEGVEVERIVEAVGGSNAT